VVDVPIHGVISDGQHSIRKAVQTALPDVPHQLCHFHYLREAAKPVPEIAAGYWEMDAELKLMHALEAVRKRQHMSQEQLAALTGKKREAISRVLSSDESNPTLSTLIELLSALNLTADITIRQAREGEGAITVALDLPPPQ
jgi:DNA-binding phage protein